MVFGGSRNVYITVTVLPKGHLRCHGGRAAIVRFPLGRGTGVPRLRYPVSSRWVAWEWYGKLVWKIYHKGVPCPWRSLQSPLISIWLRIHENWLGITHNWGIEKNDKPPQRGIYFRWGDTLRYFLYWGFPPNTQDPCTCTYSTFLHLMDFYGECKSIY